MSQRSHIAQSGSIAISECSAAWSVARSFGIRVELFELPGLGAEPDRLGLEARCRASERDELDPFLRGDRLALVADDLLGHLHLTEDELEAEPPLPAQRADHGCVGLLLRLGVPVAAERLDDRVERLLVELRDEIGLARVQVDGALVHGRVGAGALDEAEDGAARRVDDRERVGVGRAERRCAPPGSSCRPRRCRAGSRFSSGSASAAASASGPRISTSRSSIGAS